MSIFHTTRWPFSASVGITPFAKSDGHFFRTQKITWCLNSICTLFGRFSNVCSWSFSTKIYWIFALTRCALGSKGDERILVNAYATPHPLDIWLWWHEQFPQNFLIYDCYTHSSLWYLKFHRNPVIRLPQVDMHWITDYLTHWSTLICGWFCNSGAKRHEIWMRIRKCIKCEVLKLSLEYVKFQKEINNDAQT